MDEYESDDGEVPIISNKTEGKLDDLEASTSKPIQITSIEDSQNSEALSHWGTSSDVGLSIADMVAQAASEVLTEQLLPGYVYYQEYGMYYNHESGYFYDQNTSLFYHPSTQCYYYFNDQTQSYEVHSQVASQNESDKKWKKKKYLKRAKKLFGEPKISDMEQENVDILEVLFDLIIVHSEGPEILYANSDSDNDIEYLEEVTRRKAMEDESSKYPPCIRIIEISNSNQLHIVTISGAYIGSYSKCDITLKECEGLDKYHLQISYEDNEYKIWCLSQKMPVWINAEQLKGYYKIQHEDMLTIGPHRLLFHIHTGTNTCNGCEPGLLPQPVKEVSKEEKKIAKKKNVERERRRNMKALKEAYGLLGESDDEEPKPKYKDRAKIRRHTGIYASCLAAPIPGASADTVVLKTAPKVQKASVAVPINSQNKGFQLLKSMGWKEGEGLGKEGKGIVGPITSTVKTDRAGLGLPSTSTKPVAKTAKDSEKEEILKITRERYEMAKITK
uniref:Angiogenic factor with G patch and FHA domains 1 n=1 Tax=Acrobeloides nanus TaxID=290746 RepID=A0A914E9H5_9BILA